MREASSPFPLKPQTPDSGIKKKIACRNLDDGGLGPEKLEETPAPCLAFKPRSAPLASETRQRLQGVDAFLIGIDYCLWLSAPSHGQGALGR